MSKTPKISMTLRFFILSMILALTLISLAFVYLKAYLREDAIIEITGASDLAFRVFYLENNIFDTNPVPNDLHFLMSYTDFIEIDTNFRMQFDHRDVEIFYEYTATERLVIRYMSTVDSHVNPIVFHETTKLSDVSGGVFAHGLNLPADSYMLRGSYTIYPRPHIKRYLEVMADQARQMAEESVLIVGMRGLTAELFLDFTYTVWIPCLNFRQSLTSGYRLPLFSEVYSLTVTGTSDFSETIYITEDLPFEIELWTIIIFVIMMSLSGYGIFNGIKYLQADSNEKRQEVKVLLRKYENEIVISPDPVDLKAYGTVRVEDFTELIKLAVNLNKHIRCYKDDIKAIFIVVIDVDAYMYEVCFQ